MENRELIDRLRAANLVHRSLLAELLEQQGQAFWDQVLTRMQLAAREVEAVDPRFHQLVLDEIQCWVDWPYKRALVDPTDRPSTDR